MVVGHEKQAVMKYIFEQATPIKGGYSRLNDDYVARLHRGEVSQPNVDVGKLTDSLYSSMGSTSTKIDRSDTYNTPRLPQFMYASKKRDSQCGLTHSERGY